MTNSMVVVNTNQLQSDDGMFSDLEPLSAFEIKKDSLATQLAALMSYCGKSRSDMADELGWKKSRVTSVLSGHNNLTIKTICDFATHLGYDFDVIFHSYDHPRPMQPWQIQRKETSSLPMISLQTLNLPIETQSAKEVAIDLLSGKGRETYFSFNTGTLGLIPPTLPAARRSSQLSTELTLSVVYNLRR